MLDQQTFKSRKDDILTALEKLKTGEKLIYHRGFLHGIGSAVIASKALELSTEGKIHLTQRRIGPPMFRGQIDWQQGIGPGFEYIATGA